MFGKPNQTLTTLMEGLYADDITILPTPSEPFRANLCPVSTKLATSTTAAVTTCVPFDPRSIPPRNFLAHMHGWTRHRRRLDRARNVAAAVAPPLGTRVPVPAENLNGQTLQCPFTLSP